MFSMFTFLYWDIRRGDICHIFLLLGRIVSAGAHRPSAHGPAWSLRSTTGHPLGAFLALRRGWSISIATSQILIKSPALKLVKNHHISGKFIIKPWVNHIVNPIQSIRKTYRKRGKLMNADERMENDQDISGCENWLGFKGNWRHAEMRSQV